MHTLLTQWNGNGLTILSRHSGTCQRNKLTCKLPGNTQWQSQLAEPLRTDPNLKIGIGACELISTWKERKKEKKRSTDWEWFISSSFKILTCGEKPSPLSQVINHWSFSDLELSAHHWPSGWSRMRPRSPVWRIRCESGLLRSLHPVSVARSAEEVISDCSVTLTLWRDYWGFYIICLPHDVVVYCK